MSIITIGDKEFSKLSTYISSKYGIKMPDVKRTMLQARLQKRLKTNNIDSFADYCELVFSDKEEQQEVIHMIDMVSTNKTDFFREANHFEFMNTTLLPQLEANGNKQIKFWSAACSSGEEVYTIAMVVSEYLKTHPSFDFSILGSDISLQMIQASVKAVYSMERVEPIPDSLKKDYLLRSIRKEKPDVRIVPELRKKARFQRVNLIAEKYDVPRDFDVIFCRNALIYFERDVQERVIRNLLKHLNTGGFFFLGHSESITGLTLPLRQIRPTIYQKVNEI